MKTIKEIIDYVDSVKPNQYTMKQKIEWLSEIDYQIFDEIILTHVHEEGISFNGYKTGDENKELLAPEPYSNLIYTSYLEAKIDYNNAEYSKFNNSMVLFNNAYETFRKFHKRNHGSYPEKLKVKF